MQAKMLETCLNDFSHFDKLLETDVFMLLLYYYLYNVKVVINIKVSSQHSVLWKSLLDHKPIAGLLLISAKFNRFHLTFFGIWQSHLCLLIHWVSGAHLCIVQFLQYEQFTSSKQAPAFGSWWVNRIWRKGKYWTSNHLWWLRKHNALDEETICYIIYWQHFLLVLYLGLR